MSAATLEGIDELRLSMLDAAFDKVAFPSFGSSQPNTYVSILAHARRNHAQQLSVTLAEMQTSLSVRPAAVEQAQFAVSLKRSAVVNAAATHTERLHSALTAAKHAQWQQLQDVLFPDGGKTGAVPSRLLNSVPPPRSYGLIHQLAYNGDVGAYQALLGRGVVLDRDLRSTDGKTALEIAQERQHVEFATLLAGPAEVPAGAAAALVTHMTPPPDAGSAGRCTIGLKPSGGAE